MRQAGEGHNVSCDNKGALTTFDKKSKRIPVASSNANVRRALRELDRRSSARYKLEHIKGHQDRNKKLRDLTMETRLEITCDKMAKLAVEALIRTGMELLKQMLPLEKCCVFAEGEKQTSDLKEAIKQMFG